MPRSDVIFTETVAGITIGCGPSKPLKTSREEAWVIAFEALSPEQRAAFLALPLEEQERLYGLTAAEFVNFLQGEHQ